MSARREWCPKMLREQLCNQQAFAPDRFTRYEIQRLIDVLDMHRPLGPDGKHGNLHTPTCGCDDKPGTSPTDDERPTCWCSQRPFCPNGFLPRVPSTSNQRDEA